MQSRKSRQKGSALIIALIFMVVLSMLAAAIIFVTQVEVKSANSYKSTAQARYAAEAGAQAVEDWLATTNLNLDPTKIDITKYPATLVGKSCTSSDTSGCVYLSSGIGSSSYPDSTLASNFQGFFNSSTNGNKVVGVPFASYNVQAQLMTARVITVLGGGTNLVQSWKITSQGSVGVFNPAIAQVKMVIESFPSPIFSFGAFGNSTICNAISLVGLASTDSYDSSRGPWNGSTNHSNTKGDVGTNGTVDLSGNATIHGLNQYFNASGCTNIDSGTNAGTLIKMPAPIYLPAAPEPPSNLPAAISCGSCDSLTPGQHYGNVSVSGKQTLTLGAGTYYLDGLSVSGNGQISVSPPGSQVIVYILGNNGPSISGNGISNVGVGDTPANLQIIYGGSGSSSIVGNGTAQVVLYAPNSAVSVSGNGGLMGAIYGNTVGFNGGAQLHYDRQLANSLNFVGAFKTTSFTWDRY